MFLILAFEKATLFGEMLCFKSLIYKFQELLMLAVILGLRKPILIAELADLILAA